MVYIPTQTPCNTDKYPKGIYNVNGQCCNSLRFDYKETLCDYLVVKNKEYKCNYKNE